MLLHVDSFQVTDTQSLAGILKKRKSLKTEHFSMDVPATPKAYVWQELKTKESLEIYFHYIVHGLVEGSGSYFESPLLHPCYAVMSQCIYR